MTKTDGGEAGKSEGEVDPVGSGKGYSNGEEVYPKGVPTKSSVSVVS